MRQTRRPRPALIAAATLLVGAGAACADPIPPLLAPTPPRRIGACGGDGANRCPDPPPCDGPSCKCAVAGADSSCATVIDPPDSSSAALHIVSVQGPNPQRSFTTRSGERTLALTAQVRPGALAARTLWTVVDDPSDAVESAPPTVPGVPGPTSSVDVPDQSTDRWHQPHGTAWTRKALAFKVVAEASSPGTAPLRDSATVRQREADVLRQEYLDFEIPVPPTSDLKTAGDVAGLTRFGWGQLNQGDYSVIVLTPTLLAKLNDVDALSDRDMRVVSVFRNPAHHRFHIEVSGGGKPAKLSPHQYGVAVDIATYRDVRTWERFERITKSAGACVEPMRKSTTNHVHAEWRPDRPTCVPGW